MHQHTPVAAVLAALVTFASPTPAQQPGHYRVYATNEISGDLSVIDEPSHALAATIRLGTRPRGVRVSPDGRLVYVALSGSPIAGPGVDESKLPPADRSADGIGVVDATQLSCCGCCAASPIPSSWCSVPTARCCTSRARMATKCSQCGLRPARRVAARRAVRARGCGPESRRQGAVRDGRECQFGHGAGCGQRAAAREDRRRHAAARLAFTADGSRVYVTGESDASLAVIDARARKLLRLLHVPGEGARPMGVVLSRDGTRLYVATGRGGTVVPFTVADGQALAPVAVGTRPWGIALGPDDHYLYSANGQSNDVAVLDTRSLTVSARIMVGERPWGVAVGPLPGPAPVPATH